MRPWLDPVEPLLELLQFSLAEALSSLRAHGAG